MDCRTFHRDLEDYLQGGLDFPGRFGMERHAQQCISCGKEMAGAQRLHRMAMELRRVKAPADFEASVLNRIGVHKSRGHFSFVRRFWIYGLDLPSWRKLALATSGLAALGLAFYLSFRPTIPDQTPPAPSSLAIKTEKPVVNVTPEKISADLKTGIAANAAHPFLKKAAKEVPKATTPSLDSSEEEYLGDGEAGGTEYVEYMVVGPDNRPVPIRLPKKIRMQYGQASEDYFIQNVSH